MTTTTHLRNLLSPHGRAACGAMTPQQDTDPDRVDCADCLSRIVTLTPEATAADGLAPAERQSLALDPDPDADARAAIRDAQRRAADVEQSDREYISPHIFPPIVGGSAGPERRDCAECGQRFDARGGAAVYCPDCTAARSLAASLADFDRGEAAGHEQAARAESEGARGIAAVRAGILCALLAAAPPDVMNEQYVMGVQAGAARHIEQGAY